MDLRDGEVEARFDGRLDREVVDWLEASFDDGEYGALYRCCIIYLVYRSSLIYLFHLCCYTAQAIVSTAISWIGYMNHFRSPF
jgi:hypothetical protein